MVRRAMAKQARKTTDESELVQCGGILCEALKAAVQRMEASIEGLQGELRAEREQRCELQKQLGASREREEATASLVEKMEGDLRKEREGRAELEERVKELMALCPGPERCRRISNGADPAAARMILEHQRIKIRLQPTVLHFTRLSPDHRTSFQGLVPI
ncbi:hypothetical protein MTO96_051597 [Rhipicephalus appendiculatus]